MRITADELIKMRHEATLGLLTDTCTLQVLTQASDGMGGFTQSWASTTGVPCRLRPTNALSRTYVVGDQFQVHGAWVLTLRHDQAVSAGDRAVVGGETYEVLSVDDAHTDRLFRRAYLRGIE